LRKNILFIRSIDYIFTGFGLRIRNFATF
jgi:hypothetical protein